MRDIKFRCWQIVDWKDDEEETPIWGMIQAEDLAFEKYEPLVHLLQSDPESEIFMQYTGLKDKNGKDIYEGDILQGVFNIRVGETHKDRRGNRYAIYGDKEAIGIVVYDEKKAAFWFDSEFKFEYKTGFWSGTGRTRSEKRANEWRPTYSKVSDYLPSVNQRTEIIGNIYEHQYLLNSEQNPERSVATDVPSSNGDDKQK